LYQIAKRYKTDKILINNIAPKMAILDMR